LQGSYDNISAIPDLFGKRKTTHFYIKKRAEKFKRFIVSLNIFEELLSPGITQIYNQIDKSIHIEYVKNLSLMPIEERIRRLEDNYMERKPCFKYDISIKGSNRDREKQISKSIAGFLNTNGGILFIGIDNDGNVLGLRNDYSIVKNNNADGFELELRNSVDT
jgi:hypothetical protein